MENAWIELDLNLFADNIKRMRSALAPGSDIIFVVKAEAYGHGMLQVCRCAVGRGVKWFAVAHADEAIRLTDAIPGAKVMVLGALQKDAVVEAVARGIVPVVADEEQGRELAAEAAGRKLTMRCHVKVDTGMGRLGLVWDKAAGAIEAMSRLRGLAIDGICTHLARADEPAVAYSGVQVERFLGVVEDCRKRGVTFRMRHVSNSGGFQTLPERDFEGVRCGIDLYGYGNSGADARIRTRPFLHWKTRIVQARKVPAGFKVGYGSTYSTAHETVLAAVEVGYADGYSRHLGNRAQVLIGGRRVPVVGRVSMNMVMADLGPVAGARSGDEVVLLGTQGEESIWADEIARWCGTIPYEVLTNIRTSDRREKVQGQ